MPRFFYTLIFYLLLPFVFLRLFWRGRHLPAYRHRWLERLGIVNPLNNGDGSDDSSDKVVWIHTVSVGELLGARLLIESLLEKYPEQTLWVTTGTPTGSAQLLSLFGDRIRHSYIPYDLPAPVNRFLSAIRPTLAIFMETEVWPNTLAACAQAKIPTVLVNGRLSEKSYRGYRRFLTLFHPSFQQFDLVIAQSDVEADRFTQLGVKKTLTSGSLKADVRLDEATKTAAKALKMGIGDRAILIAASTHSGEEALVLDAFVSLREKHETLLLLLVPRHPHRFQAVKQLCLTKGFTTQCRSSRQTVKENTQVLLVDTLGEVLMLLGVADIAIMGGTFVDNGGHNFLEPAAWGLPIVSGNSTYNFASIASGLRDAGGLIQIEASNKSYDSLQLAEEIDNLLSSPELRQQHGLAAMLFLEESRGALDKVMQALEPHLHSAASD